MEANESELMNRKSVLELVAKRVTNCLQKKDYTKEKTIQILEQ